MKRCGVALIAALLLLACATGNADWRRESYQQAAEVRLQGAGDEKCSAPAPFTSIRACLIHDAGYELARRLRCAGHGDQEEASEQARLVADLHLAAQMAADGYPEWWVETYYRSVRFGGWWSWHFSACSQ